MLGLYIHIPFCQAICPYCDFHKMVASTTLQEKYLDALIKEANLKKLGNYQFQTVYFGGGTPSILDPKLLESFFNKLYKVIDNQNLIEITFECNPEHITEELLCVLERMNVNRISLGAQTFNKKIQELIKRKYSYDDIKEIMEKIRKHGIYNISLDLMYGFKDENIIDVLHDCDLFISLNPSHISTYCIILEEHSIFGYNKNKIATIEADEELQSKMYIEIIHKLEENNYNQYEISNFAKPNYESKHNTIYWEDLNYYSLGTGATQFINPVREMMTRKIHDYIECLNKEMLPNREVEELSKIERMDELVMMNLRLSKGLSFTNFFDRFNVDFKRVYPSYLSLVHDNLLKMTADSIFIPKEHRFISNYIIVKLIQSGTLD